MTWIFTCVQFALDDAISCLCLQHSVGLIILTFTCCADSSPRKYVISIRMPAVSNRI